MSSSNINTRVTSLVKYVLDIKPYHSKLRGFTSAIDFNDVLSLGVTDSQPQHVLYHQNVWGSADVPSLATISDGTDASKILIIPPVVMPRFSVTDALNYDQQPLGDDQPVNDLTDSNNDGVPDSSYPWIGSPSSSHQRGADSIPALVLITGVTTTVTAATTSTYTATIAGTAYIEYAIAVGIPLTALELRLRGGPTAIVDASAGSFSAVISGTYSSSSLGLSALTLTADVLAAAYIESSGFELWAVAGTGRYAVPFHHGSKVRVNNVPKTFGAADDYIVDSSRSFIQFMAGKHPSSSDYLDINLLNSDRLFISVSDPFLIGSSPDQFTITVSNAAPNRHTVSFTSSEIKVKPILEEVLIYPSETNGNIWTLTANDLFSVLVQQVYPFIGPIETAIINEPFDNGKIAFKLKSPWREYYLSSGATSYIAYDMLLFDDEYYDAPPDEADFWPGNDIKTMYGRPIDVLSPRHPPVSFSSFGELKQRDVGGKPQFIFEFYTAPARGQFIELRVEQSKQLNPRMQLTMKEQLSIVRLNT